MDVEAQLARYRQAIDAQLDLLLPPESVEPTILHQAMRYSCLAPGKRIRPSLCIAVSKALGGSQQPVLEAGCAIEMIHAFSLIHDDLPAIDDDDLRRGRETCHKKYGEAIAILAGDALFALAFQVVAGLASSSENIVRATACIAKASGSAGLVGGEVVDVLSEGTSPTEAQVRWIHDSKTGALIAAACEVGALLASENPDHHQICREFGTHVGLAFQIADDILNETSTSEALGKSAGSDRERSKATYPAAFGMEKSRQIAATELELALSCLRRLPSWPAQLAALAEYAVHRVK